MILCILLTLVQSPISNSSKYLFVEALPISFQKFLNNDLVLNDYITLILFKNEFNSTFIMLTFELTFVKLMERVEILVTTDIGHES